MSAPTNPFQKATKQQRRAGAGMSVCASSEHYHGTQAEADVHLIGEDVDLCAEHAIAYLAWTLDGCPDPAEHPEMAGWFA